MNASRTQRKTQASWWARAVTVPAKACRHREGRCDWTTRTVLPEASQAMSGLEEVVGSSTLEPEAARARAAARLADQRLRVVPGHAHQGRPRDRRGRAAAPPGRRLARGAVLHAPERAALAWTEALTLLPETGAPDDVYLAMAERLRPGRAGRAHPRHRRDQRLEPSGGRLPAARRLVRLEPPSWAGGDAIEPVTRARLGRAIPARTAASGQARKGTPKENQPRAIRRHSNGTG